jgi:pimeloyl-ACP methyl ester carboxylesterase
MPTHAADDEGMHMPTLDVEGATIAYEDTGVPANAPDAPTIVFGHGLLFSGWMFHPQVRALSDRYRCVTVDWRGQGDSPPTSGGDYEMDSLYEDAVALVEHLGVAPVHYVGLSMGGFVGQRIAARRPELLRSLTLLDTSPDREPLKAAIEDAAMATLLPLVGVKPFRTPVVKLMFGPVFRNDPANRPLIDEFVERLARCSRGAIRHAVMGVVTRKPVYDELDRITTPTLVVTGADDTPTPPAKARRIAERIPGARLEIVPDCGHSSTVEQPEIITRLIEEFVSAVDARAH